MRCKRCGHITRPMLPEQIRKGAKLECFYFHKFTDYMTLEQPNIDYDPTDYQKDSKDSRFNHIKCTCKICGKQWSPTVDSLIRGHGCPNYRDSRHCLI